MDGEGEDEDEYSEEKTEENFLVAASMQMSLDILKSLGPASKPILHHYWLHCTSSVLINIHVRVCENVHRS
jgi:hypothetical protein